MTGQRTIGVDIDVLRRAIVAASDGHRAARAFATRLSAGLETYAVAAPAVVALADILVRDGARPAWALDRAGDVLEMCRVLDVRDSDVAEGLEIATATGASPRVATTGAVFARHGIATVVSFEREVELVPHLRRLPPDALDEL